MNIKPWPLVAAAVVSLKNIDFEDLPSHGKSLVFTRIKFKLSPALNCATGGFFHLSLFDNFDNM